MGIFLFIFPHELSKERSYLQGFVTTAVCLSFTFFEASVSKIPETQLQSLSGHSSQQAFNKISIWHSKYCFGGENLWNNMKC